MHFGTTETFTFTALISVENSSKPPKRQPGFFCLLFFKMFGWNQAYLVEKKFKLKAQRDLTITAVVATLNVIFCVFSQELCITLPDKVLNSSAIPSPQKLP